MYCTLIYGYLFVSHKSFKCNLLYTFQFANFKLHVFSIKFVKFRLNLQFFLHFRYQTAHILVCVKLFHHHKTKTQQATDRKTDWDRRESKNVFEAYGIALSGRLVSDGSWNIDRCCA